MVHSTVHIGSTRFSLFSARPYIAYIGSTRCRLQFQSYFTQDSVAADYYSSSRCLHHIVLLRSKCKQLRVVLLDYCVLLDW